MGLIWDQCRIDKGSIIIMETDSRNLEILLPVRTGSLKTKLRRTRNPLKFDQKSMKKVGCFPDRSWDRFLMDFGAILGPSWDPKWSENRYKMMLKKL